MNDDIIVAVPVVRVSDFANAEVYFRDVLAFHKDWEYRPRPELPNPVYASFSRGGARVHVSSFGGDGVIGAAVAFYVRDVDALYAEFSGRGATIDLEPTDQTWGNREMYLRDPDGNRLRFVQTNAMAG